MMVSVVTALRLCLLHGPPVVEERRLWRAAAPLEGKLAVGPPDTRAPINQMKFQLKIKIEWMEWIEWI